MSIFKQIREKKTERAKHVADARAVHDKAELEKRNITPEEETQYRSFMDKADAIEVDIEKLERDLELQNAERNLNDEDQERNPGGATQAAERREAFRSYIVAGSAGISQEQRTLLNLSESRDAQVMNAITGGYIQYPMEFISEVLKVVDAISAIKSMARVFNVNSTAGIGVPRIVGDPTGPDWTAEIGEVQEGNIMNFEGRELRPHQLTKLYKMSNLLIQQAAIIDVEKLLQERIGYVFGQAEENNYANGNGQGKPLGLFVASSQGIDTDRDFVCGTDTTPHIDGLIDLQSELKSEYWPRASWLVSRKFRKYVRKLKDGTGNYLWTPRTGPAETDMLLDSPVKVSDYVPNTFTTGQYVCIYGDFNYYWILQASFSYVQKLNELFARTNQVGYISRRWIDGMPVQAEAFVRGKLG